MNLSEFSMLILEPGHEGPFHDWDFCVVLCIVKLGGFFCLYFSLSGAIIVRGMMWYDVDLNDRSEKIWEFT